MRNYNNSNSSSTRSLLMVLWAVTSLAACATTTNTPPSTLVSSCWSSDASTSSPDACSIRATLYMTPPPPPQRDPRDFGLPLDIDCAEYNVVSANSVEHAESEYNQQLAAARNAGKPHVLLDGCHAPLNAPTFGLEYLSHCADVLSVTVERFHGDTLAALQCGSSAMRVQELHFRRNEIATINDAAASFRHAAQLRVLSFEANMLRYVDHFALNATLERLSIVQEEHLMLKDGAIFESLEVHVLELVALQGSVPELCEKLPDALLQLRVVQTPIVGGVVQLLAPANLSSVDLAQCELTEFHLRQRAATSSVLRLNLSGNALREFSVSVVEDVESRLTQLDLSANRLEVLPLHWFRNLTHLQQLLLAHNRFKTLDLASLLDISMAAATTPMQFIDLRANLLERLTMARQLQHYERTRIQIDDNPWSCLWLLNFTHTQPEKFRIFAYDKFITHINVNGLACVPQEQKPQLEAMSTEADTVATVASTMRSAIYRPTTQPRMNISTYTLIYGSPWDVKRNQKQEALIIVFLLPLGIALLFVLLYLWIKCQKLFHMSYYRGCSWRKSAPSAPHFIDRFDVVRYPAGNSTPATLLANGDVFCNDAYEDGYELPLNGTNSICNCQQQLDSCQKTHHVTYEPLPEDRSYQVYAEIKESPEQEKYCHAPNALTPAPGTIYDHLCFAEATTDATGLNSAN